MLLELLKNYADMINSATRMTQRSATAMARTMLIQAGMEPAADMVSKLSEQMIAAQEAQYAMMRRMIQTEVDMTVARMGVLPAGGGSAREKTAPEAAEPDESVAELKVLSEPASAKRDGDTAESAAPDDAEPVAPEPTRLQPVRQARESAPAKEEAKTEAKPAAAAKKAPAKRTAAKKTTTRKATAPRQASATKSAAAKPAPAKSTAKKAPAKSTAKALSTRSTTKTPSSGSTEGPKADS